MTRIWFDTEFIEDGKTIDLISIGLVREDGCELYLQNKDCNLSKASDWVKKNVFPHLGRTWEPKATIAHQVMLFCGNDPEFWAYFADYDWVVLCQLYGTMMQLPDGWPMFCLDIKQTAYLAGNPSLQRPEGGDHDALADARWNRRIWHQFYTPDGRPI